ncbi:alpha/beta hydrolase [Saccharopolyspora elongata]|uniref:alpha/beta hydrolase n=1 Tax=Saccharopolyspora elongata TaxID=2530387 RepID=UPI001F19CD0B|nr:alpha/beta hydrolase [Saccharopolyspora elongata]
MPLDYNAPDGRTISIAISRVRASGSPEEYRGALLVNPGGPGGAGLNYAVAKRGKMPESVQRAYDIIGFDPRGVGHSNPVDCGPLGGLFDHPGPEPVPSTVPQERDYLNRLRAMAGDCREHAGAVSVFINTMNTARDMERIRRALHEPVLNFLGVSYGSYLGAAYAAEYPGHVGRMVLDSVVSPDRWHDFDTQQAFAMLRQRDVLFRWIADHPSLDLGSTPEAVHGQYSRARAALAENPLRGTFGPSEFDHLVYRVLSRTERWEPFARALSAYVHTGNGDGFAPEMPESDQESRNYEAALRTVKCADSTRPSTAEVIGAVRALRSVDPQPVLTGFEAATCRYWPQPRETARLGHPAMPAVLLTQASHDPTTPYPGAKRMQAVLPGSRMVVLRNGYSHGVFASQQNPCVDQTTAAYLVAGTVPPRDVDCQGLGLPAVN